MLALAVVMIAITIMLAPTVKIFFDKKAEIDALNADIAARQAEGDTLRQQVSRWQDPNYVKQQARDRINMVMPGETGYWVFGSDLPAGETSSQPVQQHKTPPICRGWMPCGVHHARGYRLNRKRKDGPPQWNTTRQPPGTNPANHQRTILKS